MSRDMWIILGVVGVGGLVIYLATREPTPAVIPGTTPTGTSTTQQPAGDIEQVITGLGRVATGIFGEVRAQNREDQNAALQRQLAKERELRSGDGGGTGRSQS